MKKLKDVTEYVELIEKNKVQIFQFGTDTCTPCAAIQLKLDQWAEEQEQAVCTYVSVNEFPQTAAKENIFTVPAILVYVEGRQTIRECGYFSLENVLKKIERYLSFLTR